MARVLVVATSRKTRGGITSVVKAHEKGLQWNQYHCKWIETHVDRGPIRKILVFGIAVLKYLWYLPSADIIHFHLSEPVSAKRKKMLFDLAKLFKKKTIIHFHSFSPNTTIKGAHRELYRFLFSNADFVVVLSNYWKEAVNQEFNLGDRVKVIYNPCPSVPYATGYEKEKSILYAGTLNQRKGYKDLITAFSIIAPLFPDWKLVFAGNGEMEEGVQLSKEKDIEKQCVFLGWVSGEEKNKAFKQASIFCLPSYAEGFPMAVLDAWAYGLPVITTPVGGIPDIAEDGKNLLLFEPGDVNKLSKCLERVIKDTGLCKRLSDASISLAKTTFNIDTINKQVGELYDGLLRN